MTADDTLLIARITVQRVLQDGRDVIYTEAVDAGGDNLPLVESLGLLRFAEDSIIRENMGETP